MARGDAPVQFTESDNSEIVGREEAEQPPGVPRAVLYGERRNTVVAKNSFRCVVSGCRSLAQGQYSGLQITCRFSSLKRLQEF